MDMTDDVFAMEWLLVSLTVATNDKFSARAAIRGASGSVAANTRWATREAGELNYEYEFFEGDTAFVTPKIDAASVWFKYTAPSGSPSVVTFSVASASGSEVFPYIIVFNDASTLAALRPAVVPGGFERASVSIGVAGGAKVIIVVDGARDALTLSWSSTRMSSPPCRCCCSCCCRRHRCSVSVAQACRATTCTRAARPSLVPAAP
jgi:hypothetical protein